MPTQDFAASIQGVALRVTRLDASGNLLNEPGDSYTTTQFMRVSFTNEFEEGDEITEKGANGLTCVTFKSPDTLKRITMEIAVCEPNPEFTQLVSGGLLLRKNLGTFGSPDRKSIGWGSPAVGDDPSGYGVAVEVWSRAIKDGKPAASLPYFHWIMPYVKVRLSGDRVIENGLMANTFEGFGLGNSLFGDGPDERWEFPVSAARPYSYARSAWAPTGLNGFYVWHGVLTATITNKELTSNVATLTTSTPHGFSVGETVTITGTLGAPFTGVYTITTVPTTTTFTYAKVNADVTSAADTGTAVVDTGSVAVNDFAGQGSTTEFNVPGNLEYSAEEDYDGIIASTEDPVA